MLDFQNELFVDALDGEIDDEIVTKVIDAPHLIEQLSAAPDAIAF